MWKLHSQQIHRVHPCRLSIKSTSQCLFNRKGYYGTLYFNLNFENFWAFGHIFSKKNWSMSSQNFSIFSPENPCPHPEYPRRFYRNSWWQMDCWPPWLPRWTMIGIGNQYIRSIQIYVLWTSTLYLYDNIETFALSTAIRQTSPCYDAFNFYDGSIRQMWIEKFLQLWSLDIKI